MKTDQAIKAAKAYMAKRKSIRKLLIEEARARNPVEHGQRWPDNEIRKLYQFPSDLSEERLLKLIGVN